MEKVKQNAFKAFFGKIAKYFRELRSEAKKIIWPSKKQTINNTVIVLAVVLVFAVVIGIFDISFGKMFEYLVSLVSPV